MPRKKQVYAIIPWVMETNSMANGKLSYDHDDDDEDVKARTRLSSVSDRPARSRVHGFTGAAAGGAGQRR